MPAPETPLTGRPSRRRLPLYLRVLTGVALGIVCGLALGTRPILFGLGTQDLHDLGMLVIRFLKAMAIPLIFVAIIDAFLRTEISARQCARLVVICLFNVSVAFAIGLTIMNLLRPGLQWRGHIEEITGLSQESLAALPPRTTLNPIQVITDFFPKSIAEPFVENRVIPVVLLAVLAGVALRRIRKNRSITPAQSESIQALITGSYQALVVVLGWIVELIPFAVAAVMTYVVAKSGLKIFGSLWIFLGTILLGLAIHSLLYYPLMAWWLGKRTPRAYLGGGADAILTGLSTNSSLASVPVTLHCLTGKMGVSDESARLAACVGTNLNNDGITLYDAMAALFLAQAFGYDLTFGQQATVVFASLMAGIGIAGIPEAGLIVLPLVLSAAGLPENAVVAAIPVIFTVDWIIARCRSAVNVMSDILVAILLDAGKGQSQPRGRG